MRLAWSFSVVCLLAIHAASAATPNAGKDRQIIQFGVTLAGACNNDLATAINKGLRKDIQQKVVAKYGQGNARAVVPKGTPALSSSVTSRIPGDNTVYCAYRVVVQIVGTTLNNEPKDNQVQRDAIKDLNNDWKNCKAGFNAKNNFPSLEAALNGAKPAINRATKQLTPGRMPADSLQPCTGTNPPIPSSPSPPPASTSPAPPASPSPPPVDCANIPNSVLVNGVCTCTGGFPVKAYNGLALSACLATGPCPTTYPVIVRETLGSGPIESCATTTGPCPAGRSFAYYKGTPANLFECTSPATLCNLAPFTRRVENDDAAGSLAGCLESSLATTECPSKYGFGVAYYDSADKLVKCRPTSQTGCQSPFAIQGRGANDQLLACLQLAGDICPDRFKVFARTFLNGPLVQCRTLDAGCPSSTEPSRNFPLQLSDGQVLQGCIPIPGGITTCDSFGLWNGPEIYDNNDKLIGCLRNTASKCYPTNYLPYYDTNTPTAPIFLQCRPPLSPGQTCISRTVTVGSAAYSTTARGVDGAIVACLRESRACPSAEPADFPVFATDSYFNREKPVECLARNTPSCPMGTPRVVGLYRGVRQIPPADAGLPTPILDGCVERTVANCDDAQYGAAAARTYLAEVWGRSDGTDLIGCVSNGGSANPLPTPCPASSPVLFQAAGPNWLTECRPTSTCRNLLNGVNPVSTYTVQLKSGSGALLGCRNRIEAPLNNNARACPTNSESDATILNGATAGPLLNYLDTGAPYNFAFNFIGKAADADPTPAPDQCRPILLIPATSCSAYTNLDGHTVPVWGAPPGFPPVGNAGLRPPTNPPLIACSVPTARCPAASENFLAGGGTYAPMLAKGGAVQTVVVDACVQRGIFGTTCSGGYPIPVTNIKTNGPLAAVNFMGCLKAGTEALTCLAMSNGGFPFRSGATAPAENVPGTSLTTFIVDATAAPTNTLKSCGATDGYTCDGATYITKVYDKPLPGPRALIGCTGPNTLDRVSQCTSWVTNNWNEVIGANAQCEA